MRTPEKLLYDGLVVATLQKFSYEFPWASAEANFLDDALKNKLESLATFNRYDSELEEMGLSDKEEEALWEKKRSELGLTLDDLKLGDDEPWSVICDDGTKDDVRAISCEDGWLEWRA